MYINILRGSSNIVLDNGGGVLNSKSEVHKPIVLWYMIWYDIYTVVNVQKTWYYPGAMSKQKHSN